MYNSVVMIICSCFLSSVSTFTTTTGAIECSRKLPSIDLGEVDLSPLPRCEQVMGAAIDECVGEYTDQLRDALYAARCNIYSETVRRHACCGVWVAKHCLAAKAASFGECGKNISEQYRALPSTPYYKTEVADQCSEYGEHSGVCEVEGKAGGFSLYTLIVVLLVTIAVLLVILVALRIKQKYSSMSVIVDNDHDEGYGDVDDGHKAEEMKSMMKNGDGSRKHSKHTSSDCESV